MNIRNIKAAFLKETPFFMATPAFVWQVLFFYVPLFVMVVFSFSSTWDFTCCNFLTTQNYRVLWALPYFFIILRSFLLALATATICLLLGYPVAYFLSHRARSWSTLLLPMVIVPLWTNLIVLAYSWFFILEKNGLINTLLMRSGIIESPIQLLNTTGAVLCVMVYCYLPFMVMPLYNNLEKLDHRLIEASLDLGATPVTTFFRVVLPLTQSGIRTGFFLVFIPSFGEFVIPALLGGAKNLYVGSLISHYFLTSRDVFMGSAFTCLSSCFLILGALLLYGLLGRLLRGK